MKIKFKNKEEAEKAFELFVFTMENLMELNNANRFRNPPIYTDEEAAHLKDMMDFCQSILKQARHESLRR